MPCSVIDRLALVLILAMAAANRALAEKPDFEAIPPGHSLHGQVFNEGPRQAAYLMGGTGPVRFPVTSSVPDVQAFIEQGIGQVHGFWYFEAERSFRQAATLDPDCAAAYWGMALANEENAARAKGFLAEALKRRGHASEREAMYLDALDGWLNGRGDRKEKAKGYVAALRAIAQRYPGDLEAKALLGYALYKHRGELGKRKEEVDAALKDVLAVEPMHPVHHYRIHLWDSGDSKDALDSSARCGQSAPAIAHMWHMSGHTYSRLKRYADAAWQQEASARVDHAHMMHDNVLPDEIHNFAHNNEWLIRDLIYIGRWQDARDLAVNMLELPRHPRYNTLASRRSAYFGRIRLYDVLWRFEQWQAIVDYSTSGLLEPTGEEAEQVRRLQQLAMAYAHLNQPQRAGEPLAELRARLDPILAKAEILAGDRLEGPPAKPSNDEKQRRERLEKAIASVEGHLAAAAGDHAGALKLLRQADEEKPVLARVQFLAGQQEAALKEIAEYVKSRPNQVHPLAVQADLLWQAQRKDEARQAFEDLRKISGSIQFGSPLFDRLTPIASELGIGEDWRLVNPPASDVGLRPDLDCLGPPLWSPTSAPPWSLADHAGKQFSLADFQGRAVVVIFYLGHGCLHCAEQLKKFAPLAQKFHDAGIELVAISSDDPDGLKLSLESYGRGMPFPLLADAGLDVFRAYRAYDDFEQKPLHATFLIDGAGQMRWHDIGHEPFMDADFLLGESQRLLGLPRRGGAQATAAGP